MMKFPVMMAIIMLCAVGVYAQDVVINDSCYSGGMIIVGVSFDPYVNVSTGFGPLVVSNSCTGGIGTEVLFDNVTLVLGPIMTGEVIIGNSFVYVDSFTRPDLDVPSTITFNNVPFVVRPMVERDGVLCGDCNVTFDPVKAQVIVRVTGFSNYSLIGSQDFTVQSDPQPELAGKVYQTIDLGDTHRAEEFKCLVQLYGRNEGGQWVLIQTNPERKVPATIFGNPDTNNPESLGYFKTENGLANVYFDGTKVTGYQDFEYVAQCANNATKLVYEEPISTRFKPAGRAVVSRGVWLTSGSNGFYTSMILIVGFFVVLFVLVIIRTWWRVLRGR